MTSAIWRTVLGPRLQRTRRMPISASVGLRRGSFMVKIIYDVLRSVNTKVIVGRFPGGDKRALSRAGARKSRARLANRMHEPDCGGRNDSDDRLCLPAALVPWPDDRLVAGWRTTHTPGGCHRVV